jgi:RNA polymerase sigma factor (sigma-70 family)
MSDGEPPSESSTVPESFSPSSDDPLSRNDEFKAFYTADLPRLVAFLMYLEAPADQARDVAQEAMAQAFQRWESIERPRAWVRTVATRQLIRSMITDNRDTPLDDGDSRWLLGTALTDVADWEARHEILRDAKRLPPRQRQVIAWWLDGYSPVEIASELQITPVAVRANLKKARHALNSSSRRRKSDD